jgi:biotin carboxyl carrier protein
MKNYANIYFKASGKKSKLPQAPSDYWEFTQRSGGWIVAECFQQVKGIKTSCFRKKMMFAESRNYLSAHFGTSTWFGELLQEVLGGASGSKASETDLIAQFPGKVRKVMVQENEEVKEGTVLVLIEAMKMEFAIRAPSSGRVIRMRVSEGEQIAPGTKFLDWEALENES